MISRSAGHHHKSFSGSDCAYQLWSYLLQLSVIVSLSDGVPQRDLGIAKKANLILAFDLGAGQNDNLGADDFGFQF